MLGRAALVLPLLEDGPVTVPEDLPLVRFLDHAVGALQRPRIGHRPRLDDIVIEELRRTEVRVRVALVDPVVATRLGPIVIVQAHAIGRLLADDELRHAFLGRHSKFLSVA